MSPSTIKLLPLASHFSFCLSSSHSQQKSPISSFCPSPHTSNLLQINTSPPLVFTSFVPHVCSLHPSSLPFLSPLQPPLDFSCLLFSKPLHFTLSLFTSSHFPSLYAIFTPSSFFPIYFCLFKTPKKYSSSGCNANKLSRWLAFKIKKPKTEKYFEIFEKGKRRRND